MANETPNFENDPDFREVDDAPEAVKNPPEAPVTEPATGLVQRKDPPPALVDDAPIDEFQVKSFANKLHEVAHQVRVTAARNKHQSALAAANRASMELVAAEQHGNPVRPEPVFGDVSTPAVVKGPTPDDPNRGLTRIKNLEEVNALIRGGHRVRAFDMPASHWFSIQRRKGQPCYVMPVSPETDLMLLREGKTYYLLPD